MGITLLFTENIQNDRISKDKKDHHILLPAQEKRLRLWTRLYRT